ncbi:hypothetical protein [Nonomuraea sp. B19D2]|uniref:hypothetical protein n=1 Tax=Nonomuraea sp. B19D2 TaxID=3159561 RepID=UPI0032DB1433
MPENDQNNGDQNVTTPPATDTGTGDNVDVAALIADRDKWKHFAREHENKWQTLSGELAQLKQSQMSEAEKAIEAAKAEARSATLAEVGGTLATAELEKRAAKAGVTLPDPSYINLAAFMGADGNPNGEAIDAFIGTLPKPSTAPEFDQSVLNNAGNREANKPQQLTRADLQRMTPEEIEEARLAGKLNDLLGIK